MTHTPSNRRRYGMYPNKAFAGHVECETMEDGQIKVYMWFHPFDGEERTMVVDPATDVGRQTLRQLHLRDEMPKDPHSGGFVMDIDSFQEPLKSQLNAIFNKAYGTE